jgi:hypothetical protein
MLITIDGRRIRANRRITYVVANVSPDGRYVYLDERHDDGTIKAGPTVQAAEWHRHDGNVWVPCSGSRRRPERTKTTSGHWVAARCAVCGTWDGFRQDGTIWAHKRPQGQRFAGDGVQIITYIPTTTQEA